MEWVARLTVVGVEMVLFGLAGLWLDARLNVRPLFALVGFAVGIAVGLGHLLLMTAQDQKRDSAKRFSGTKSNQTPSDPSRRKTDE